MQATAKTVKARLHERPRKARRMCRTRISSDDEKEKQEKAKSNRPLGLATETPTSLLPYFYRSPAPQPTCFDV